MVLIIEWKSIDNSGDYWCLHYSTVPKRNKKTKVTKYLLIKTESEIRAIFFMRTIGCNPETNLELGNYIHFPY